MAKTNKFNVPNGLVSQGKTCLEKLKTLLKFLDGTTSLILRSSKRWSMAAAISVGIDETDELMTDEDTLAGKQHSDLFMNSVHCIGNNSPKCSLTLFTMRHCPTDLPCECEYQHNLDRTDDKFFQNYLYPVLMVYW